MSTELDQAKARKSTVYNPARFAETLTPVSVSTTATLVLAADGRKGHTIYNNGASILYVGGDNTITAATGIPVQPGMAFTFDQNNFTYSGDIYAITSAGTAVVRCVAFY